MPKFIKDNSFFEVLNKGDFLRPGRDAEDAFADVSHSKRAIGLISLGITLSLFLSQLSSVFLLLPAVGSLLLLIGCMLLQKSSPWFAHLIGLSAAQLLWFAALVVLDYIPAINLGIVLTILGYLFSAIGLLQLICLRGALTQLKEHVDYTPVPVPEALYILLFILGFWNSDLIIITRVVLCIAGAVILFKLYRSAD